MSEPREVEVEAEGKDVLARYVRKLNLLDPLIDSLSSPVTDSDSQPVYTL